MKPSVTHPAASAPGALAGLALSMLLSSLGTSVANVALPTLALELGVSFSEVQWVVIAYLLAITTLIVGVGRLGDIGGRRRLLLIGIAVFTVASGLCVIASRLGPLIAARAAQGAGAAIMLALSVAMVGETVTKERTGRAMGLLGTMSAVGTALGPSLGGLLIAGWGWPAIFLINLPLGVLAFGLIFQSLPLDPSSTTSNRPRFDLPGTLVLGLTLAAAVLAVTLGRGHFDWLNGILLTAAAVGSGLFWLVEVRSPSPLVSVALFGDPGLRAGLGMNALVSAVMMATLVVGPFYLALALGLDPAAVGIVMSAGPILSALCGIPAGRLADRFGTLPIVIVGLVMVVLGSLALALLPAWFGLAGYLAAVIILTPGYQLFQAANNTETMGRVPPDRRGVVSGVLNLSRYLGLLTGASAMGAVFAWGMGTADPASATAQAVASGMTTTFLAASLLGVIALGVALARSPHH